jgi:hypothetical protein
MFIKEQKGPNPLKFGFCWKNESVPAPGGNSFYTENPIDTF